MVNLHRPDIGSCRMCVVMGRAGHGTRQDLGPARWRRTKRGKNDYLYALDEGEPVLSTYALFVEEVKAKVGDTVAEGAVLLIVLNEATRIQRPVLAPVAGILGYVEANGIEVEDLENTRKLDLIWTETPHVRVGRR